MGQKTPVEATRVELTYWPAFVLIQRSPCRSPEIVGERRPLRLAPIKFGMHVYDAHEQLLGTVVLARKDHFVMRQELGINQLVAVPVIAVGGVVGGIVFLCLTPGEIEIFCKSLERKERGASGFSLLPRLVPPQKLAEQS